MATDTQIAANRRNSQKSTGPRTLAGKAASSRNALRSGLYAESRIIDRENAEDYETLARDYFDDCQPRTPREAALVDELVQSEWLLRRMHATETQLWNEDIAERRRKRGDEFDPDTALAITFHRTSEKLNLVQRRLSALSRQYHRALHDLDRLQDARRSPENGFVPSETPGDRQPPAPEPSATSPASPAVPIGFVPSNSPQTPATSSPLGLSLSSSSTVAAPLAPFPPPTPAYCPNSQQSYSRPKLPDFASCGK